MRYRGVPFHVGMRARAPKRRRFSLDPRGQGLVEFAISFPVVMLMILFGIDFGRVFLGWVTLTNAVREAANFAAINPTAWGTPGSSTAQAEYERLITDEAAAINCTLPATLPDPVFPNGTAIGSPAVVSITCDFGLITPLIGNIVGNPLDVSASASFPVRSGAIAGTPVGQSLPTGTPGATAPQVTVPPGGPTATPIPTPSPVITPVPTCVIPDLVTGTLRTNQATQAWTAAGFVANNLLFSPLVPRHYDINDQSIDPSASVPCTTAMTVYDSVQP
jgi:TadE-like protein